MKFLKGILKIDRFVKGKKSPILPTKSKEISSEDNVLEFSKMDSTKQVSFEKCFFTKKSICHNRFNRDPDLIAPQSSSENSVSDFLNYPYQGSIGPVLNNAGVLVQKVEFRNSTKDIILSSIDAAIEDANNIQLKSKSTPYSKEKKGIPSLHLEKPALLPSSVAGDTDNDILNIDLNVKGDKSPISSTKNVEVPSDVRVLESSKLDSTK